MNIPVHPARTDDEVANGRSRRRWIITVICVALVAGCLHLLRGALG